MPRALNGYQKHDRPARPGSKGHKRTTHIPDAVALNFCLFTRITRQAMYCTCNVTPRGVRATTVAQENVLNVMKVSLYSRLCYPV